MIEKDCNTCLFVWQPSKLYTAYLAEKERADNAEAVIRRRGEIIKEYLCVSIELTARVERFKRAINCGCDNGMIDVTPPTDVVYGGSQTYRKKIPCSKCAEIRKEAGNDDD